MRRNKKLKFNTKNKRKGIRKKKLTLPRIKWITKSKSYSSYPYLLTVSFFRRNIFFNLSDFIGHTKYWTNAGRNGFIGSTKIAYLAVVTITKNFIEHIWKKGIRCVILKYNKSDKLRKAIVKGIFLVRKTAPIRFIGILTKISITFNGCRDKKKRRK